MGVLDRVDSPADLRALSADEMLELATEIREFLIEKVAATGGHLGPNLGVVELTLALHRVFDSPTDPPNNYCRYVTPPAGVTVATITDPNTLADTIAAAAVTALTDR